MTNITPKFKNRMFLFDFARSRSLDKTEMICLLDLLCRAGFNGVAFYTECFFERKKYPGMVREGCLTLEDAAWLCKEIEKRGMQIMPAINLVGHCESLMWYQERFSDMRRDDINLQMNLKDERLEKFAYDIIDEVIEIFHPKYLNIGGDETTLDDDEKELYAKFLSKVGSYVIKKGVKPFMWGDMVYLLKDIPQELLTDIGVGDWFYNGHRKKSLEFFKDKGFKDIFAVVSDNGWDGFIGVQRHSPWGQKWPKDEPYIEVDEIEAFLQDAYEVGIENIKVANFENFNGHNLWSCISAIVRGGLYSSGKDTSEENIEKTIFGRVTPHTKATLALQKIQYKFYDEALLAGITTPLKCRISDAIFNKEKYILMTDLAPKIYDKIKDDFEDGLSETAKLLDSWEAQGEIEDRCKRSLVSAMHYANALLQMIKLNALGYMDYHEAALCQFDNKKKCCDLLSSAMTKTEEFRLAVKAFSLAQKAAIDDCGQTKKDIEILDLLEKNLRNFAGVLEDFRLHISSATIKEMRVLPSWRKIVKEIINI